MRFASPSAQLRRSFSLLALFLASSIVGPLPGGVAAEAEQPAAPKKPVEPSANTADEPLAARMSVDAAVKFLDQASIAWTQNRKCFACHTNYAYLYARPLVNAAAPEHQQIRAALEQMVDKTWKTSGPRWDAEVISAAAALAFNDKATTGKLHPSTVAALDRMWTVQKEDGGWNWLKCGWPPMESDDHYGATLAALAVGFAPGDYARTPQAQKGLGKIRDYLKANPPPTLHHEAMLLWASTYHDGILDDAGKKAVVEKLSALQKADGGWATATIYPWKRGDGKEQDLETSDGYGTSFTIYVLRRAGVEARDPRIEKGVAWIQSHQRESGRWFSRSLHKDNKHFLTNAGTAFSVMALAECGLLERRE